MSFISGMVDKVDLFRYTLQDDGAGGQIQNAKVYLYRNIFARITVMDAKTQLGWFGFSGRKLWKVIAQYSPSLDNTGEYYLQLNKFSPRSVINSGEIFRVIESRHQRDENGTWHHTSAAIERDERAEE